jgi:hypothetical protein
MPSIPPFPPLPVTAPGLPMYLEASSEGSRRLYARLGFRDRAILQVDAVSQLLLGACSNPGTFHDCVVCGVFWGPPWTACAHSTWGG